MLISLPYAHTLASQRLAHGEATTETFNLPNFAAENPPVALGILRLARTAAVQSTVAKIFFGPPTWKARKNVFMSRRTRAIGRRRSRGPAGRGCQMFVNQKLMARGRAPIGTAQNILPSGGYSRPSLPRRPILRPYTGGRQCLVSKHGRLGALPYSEAYVYG